MIDPKLYFVTFHDWRTGVRGRSHAQYKLGTAIKLGDEINDRNPALSTSVVLGESLICRALWLARQERALNPASPALKVLQSLDQKTQRSNPSSDPVPRKQ